VYVGFGNTPMRVSKDIARVAIEAIRAQCRRALVSHSWADLAPMGQTRRSAGRAGFCTVIGTPQTLMTCPIPADTEVGDKIDIALTVKVGPDADLSTIFTAARGA
jgi:hypothetical protein